MEQGQVAALLQLHWQLPLLLWAGGSLADSRLSLSLCSVTTHGTTSCLVAFCLKSRSSRTFAAAAGIESGQIQHKVCLYSIVAWIGCCVECLYGCRASAAWAQPNTQLAAVSWSCGWQACAVLHHATTACLQHSVVLLFHHEELLQLI